MNGSRKIRVIKSDQLDEAFDVGKLSASLFRAMQSAGAGSRIDAAQFAIAIRIYLRRTRWLTVTSDAISDLAVKVLGRCGHGRAAEAMLAWRKRRGIARTRLSVLHEGGERTQWDKNWLSCWARNSWLLSRKISRIVAGQVERELLEGKATVVSRVDVLDMLNRFVAQYGLADAVPVRQTATT